MSSTPSKRLKRVWALSEDARMAGRSTIKVADLEAALAGTYGRPYAHTLESVAAEFGVDLNRFEVGDRVLVNGILSPATVRSVEDYDDGEQGLGVDYDDDSPEDRGTHEALASVCRPYFDTEDNR